MVVLLDAPGAYLGLGMDHMEGTRGGSEDLSESIKLYGVPDGAK